MDTINNNCQGCVFTLLNFLKITDLEKLQFLQDHGAVENAHNCPTCQEPCKLNAEQHWRCQRQHIVRKNHKKKIVRCSFRMSLKTGTFFENSKFPMTKIANFIALALLLESPTQLFLEREMDWSHQTMIDWHSFFWEVLVDWAVDNSDGTLGGKGKYVEIDETKMGKRKNDRGHLEEGQWLFGGIERNSKKMFILPVENNKKETLINVIQVHILPGTTIITDCWKAYKELYQENCKNSAITNTINFVSPQTWAHTHVIDHTWQEAKPKIPKYDRKEEHFPGYLAEFAFRHKYPDHRERLHEYFLAVAKFYNPRTTNNNKN